jgi:hypothetical protein
MRPKPDLGRGKGLLGGGSVLVACVNVTGNGGLV